MTYKLMARQNEAFSDLDEATSTSTAIYISNPADLQNLLNLALYHVARGNEVEAEALYREGITTVGLGKLMLKGAIVELDNYLTIFPGDELATRMRELLAEVS
jgi:hypothetical protein